MYDRLESQNILLPLSLPLALALFQSTAALTMCVSHIQGGEDPYASSCRPFSAKEPLIIGLFCGK